MLLESKLLSEITTFMKYAKYLPEKQRRESWDELVDRNENMHIEKFPQLAEQIRWAYGYVRRKEVLPSMRSMQFAGKPIQLNNARIYNCSFLPIDHMDAFSETMFLLLSGCFEENTEIKTRDGVKKIKDITVYDYILTYDTDNSTYHWTRPFAVLPTPSEGKQKIELTFEDGSVVQCTDDHKFFVNGRGWVEARDLTEDDDIEAIQKIDDDIETREYTEEEIRTEYPQFFRS